MKNLNSHRPGYEYFKDLYTIKSSHAKVIKMYGAGGGDSLMK